MLNNKHVPVIDEVCEKMRILEDKIEIRTC